MNKRGIVSGALCACLASLAFAGSKFTGNGNVVITRAADGSGVASGNLGSIYNGPDMVQWIGCQRGSNDAVYCSASNATAGTLVACSGTSAFLARSISSISPDARVAFWWNAQGACTRIQVIHSSEYEDKQG